MHVLSVIVCLSIPLLLQQIAPSSLEGRLLIPSNAPNNLAITINLESVSGVTVEQTLPDSNGNFAFHGLAPGTYFLRVNHPGLLELREIVRVPLVGQVVIALSSLFGYKTSAKPPADGTYTVDFNELKLPQKAKSEYEIGLNDHNEGDSRHAIEHFQRAIKIAPRFYRARLWLGREYEKVGRLDDAEKEFRKVAQLRPEEVEPLSRLGELQLREDRTQEALGSFNAAVDRDSRSVAAAFGSGLALYRMGDFDNAEKALLGAQTLSPANPAVRLLLVNVFLKKSAWDRAVSQIDAYLKENPDSNKRDEVERIRRQILAIPKTPGG